MSMNKSIGVGSDQRRRCGFLKRSDAVSHSLDRRSALSVKTSLFLIVSHNTVTLEAMIAEIKKKKKKIADAIYLP